MMKSIDIRSESAIKLLAEFLDMDVPYVEGGRHVNAEHFAHGMLSLMFEASFTLLRFTPTPVVLEPDTNGCVFLEVYSYVRSPFRDLFMYDNVVQVGFVLNILLVP